MDRSCPATYGRYRGGAMAHQYVFTMHRLSKVHPPDKTVLKDITLAFLPGAKIGVLGHNGSGKSTLLRIMAGRRHRGPGRRAARPRRDGRAARAGAAARPGQGRARQRRGRRRGDPRAARPLQRARGQLLGRHRRRVRRPAGEDRRRRRLEPRHERRVRDGRAASAARRRRRRRRCPAASAAASRSAGCSSARPTCCSSTSPPTTSTPSRSPGSNATWPSTRAPSSPSPTTATSSTTSRAGSSSSTAGAGSRYEGNYSSWLEQKQARLAQEQRSEKARQRTIAAELEWVRQNPHGRQTKQKARLRNFEALVAEERNVKLDEVQIHIPTSTHLGTSGRRGRGPAQGLRRQPAHRGPVASRCRPAGSSASSAPNGAGKTTLFRMITGQEQPDAGTLRIGETVQMAYVDQSRDALDPTTHGLGGDLRTAWSRSRSATAG